MNINLRRRPVRLAVALFVAAAGFVVNLGVQAYAQQVKREQAKKEEESFRRPEPTRPIRPEIPSANRYQQDKIFLEYADSLFKIETRDTVQRQIVKGNVKFRQAGMWMFCDSAYYYPDLNSLDAFGNVRMEQGDTLFVFADRLFYEGNDRMARLKNGPSRQKVQLINKDVTLTTDSLDYSIAMELGWYSKWGTIDDKVNTLTSLYGEYSPGTKNADFFHDVVLVNNRDGYTMLTDTLHYSTATHIARIESRTEIQSANDTIITTSGIYNTDEGNAELLSRSIILHRDSNNNVTTLEGDSIIYDNVTRISRAFMFRGPHKVPMPMVITDTAHNLTLIGGFGLYNDSTREALATDYPLLMEYSQGDTLFLRADTIKTFIIREMVAASRRWTSSGFPEKDGRVILSASDGIIWTDPDFFRVFPPLAQKPSVLLAARAPQKVEKKEPEKTVPPIPDKLDPRDELRNGLAEDGYDSLSYKIDEHLPLALNTADSLDSVTADSLNLVQKDSIPLVEKEFHVAQAYHRARFFKQDIQGVADSMIFVERDSMMFMFRKPIVWSGERQVTGNRIDVHFNDSTADWALLPESGMLSELVDEDFYNQLAGKKLFATFAEQTLKDLDVSGNVEVIFLPQESDSTYNRLVAAESSYLTMETENGQMARLKMWPEVSGTVSPLFMVKRTQQYLRQFRWWGSLRPKRERVGDRWRWEDNLGEVPEDLDAYFLAPTDFTAPKSFPASRPVVVPPPIIKPSATIAGDSIPAEVTVGVDTVSAPLSEPLDSVAAEEVPDESLPMIEASEEKMSEEVEAVEKQSAEEEEAVEQYETEEGIKPEETE